MPVYLQTVRGHRLRTRSRSRVTPMEGAARPPRRDIRDRLRAVRNQVNRPFGYLKRFMPRGFFRARLLIIVTPMVLLQLIVTLIFFERHYQLVTRRLSRGCRGRYRHAALDVRN